MSTTEKLIMRILKIFSGKSNILLIILHSRGIIGVQHTRFNSNVRGTKKALGFIKKRVRLSYVVSILLFTKK